MSAARDGLDPEAYSDLLEDSVEDLYENAPCGYLSTLPDGRLAKVNTTLLTWLGYERGDLVGRRHFSDLLTVGGRIYYETHLAPLLAMQGEVSGIALELKTADGDRLPVLVTSKVKNDRDGQPLLVRTTIFDARERRAYEAELLRARQQAEQERERLRRVNATLQATLLPPALPRVPGLEVAAHYHIASLDEVGGDFYDLFPLADGNWGVFLGDVCGKGAPAAVVTSLARYTLRAAAVHAADPAVVLTDLNTALNNEFRGWKPTFCTVIFGMLTPAGAGGFHLTLASGGHPPALLMRADGSARFLPTTGGQLIGALPDPTITTIATTLAPGDTLLLYTDGITEARTAAGDRHHGEQVLLDLVRDHTPNTAATVVDAIRGLLDTLGEGVEDDTAVLAIHAFPRARD